MRKNVNNVGMTRIASLFWLMSRLFWIDSILLSIKRPSSSIWMSSNTKNDLAKIYLILFRISSLLACCTCDQSHFNISRYCFLCCVRYRDSSSIQRSIEKYMWSTKTDLFRYGEIFPVLVAGRIIACLCALVGAGMMGMLVSILIEKYHVCTNERCMCRTWKSDHQT